MVYFTFSEILTLTFQRAHRLELMCNSFNSSISPSFGFQRFDFKGKSVLLKRRIKALFANWP